MNILFIHQNFPGQFKHLLQHLASQKQHELVGLGIQQPKEKLPKGVQYFQYSIHRGNTKNIHRFILELETKTIRAEACARRAEELKKQGFRPDLIYAHPGWGESLFLKEVWPNTPILLYQEFFLLPYWLE